MVKYRLLSRLAFVIAVALLLSCLPLVSGQASSGWLHQIAPDCHPELWFPVIIR